MNTELFSSHKTSKCWIQNWQDQFLFSAFPPGPERMLTVPLLTHEITVAIRIVWGYEREEVEEKPSLNFSCSLTSSHSSSFLTELQPLVTIVFVCHDPSALFLSFSKEKIKPVFLKVYFFKRNYVVQNCILSLHLMMFQRVHRSCALTARSVW